MFELGLLNLMDAGVLKLFVYVVYYILFHVYRAKLFTKAGKRGIVTLIPVYGGMKQYEVAKMSKLCYLVKFLPLVILYKPFFSWWLLILTLLLASYITLKREIRTVSFVFERHVAFGICLYLFPVVTWMYLFAEKNKKNYKKKVIDRNSVG